MDLTSLISDLESKGYSVKGVYNAEKSPEGQSVRDSEGVNWKIVGTYVQSGNTLIRINVPIYIKAEGTKDEEAYYAEKEPVSKIKDEKSEISFADSLKEYLNSQDWIGYEIVKTVDSQKFALVTAYILSEGSVGVSTKIIILDKEGFSLYDFKE